MADGRWLIATCICYLLSAICYLLMERWLSLYWAWLLPALAVLGTLARWREVRRARRWGLISRRGWRWLSAGLAAAQALIWLTWLALIYQTNFWLAGGGLAAIGLMLLAGRTARAEVHPGLHGFQRPLPRDGLELIEREQHVGRPGDRLKWGLGPWLPLLPALSLILFIASYDPSRWLDFGSLALSLAAPLLLTRGAYRRHWIALLLLGPPLIFLMAQALSLHAALPAGQWITPITGARCTGQIRMVRAGRAWCANARTGAIYQFDLRTRVVTVKQHVTEGVRVLAANGERGWVQQVPARGLVRVSADAVEALPVRSAHAGAADAEGRLWVIDAGSELVVYAGADPPQKLFAKDGLLNNTANVVKASLKDDIWVGSIGGVSWLRAGERRWQTFGRESGVPGAVINFAFAPDGSTWMLWQARPGYGALSDWGVSRLTPEGVTLHLALGPQTGLEAPRCEDALAIDKHGRLWFVTQSIPRREKFLGVVAPTLGARPQVYSLGHFATRGPYAYGGSGLWQNSFGVVADGQGGILLYNGDAVTWRHWSP
jgi:sugar lactone lactonase YvrE